MRDRAQPVSRRDVCCDVMHAGRRASRGIERAVVTTFAPFSRSTSTTARADPLRPGRDERSAARESEIEAHAVISSLAIVAPSSVKRYRSSTGLPGKSPVTRAVTVTSGPETSTASGSLV